MTSSNKSSETAAPPGRREANVAARRRRILESARKLLAEAGQNGLSMRKLAREADLSVTTLYNLVGSREDILRALIEDSAERLESRLKAPPSSGDPLQRTVEAFDNFLGYLVDAAADLKPLIVANFATGYRRELGKEERGLYFHGAKESVRECLLSALAEGQLREVASPKLLEAQLYVGMELALDRWAFGLIDSEEFRAKGLWGVYVTFLAFASPESRPRLEKELRKLERSFEKGRGSAKRQRSTRR